MPRYGIIQKLENTLIELQAGQKELKKRISKIEKAVDKKTAVRTKPGRKPGKKKRGRPPKKSTAKRVRKPKKKLGRKPTRTTCSVKGCKRPHYAKGLCAKHYQQKRNKKLKK